MWAYLQMSRGRTYRIFISHAFRDSDLYHRLIDELRGRGHFRFQDKSVPDIRLIENSRPRTTIRRRIKSSDVILVLTRPIASRSEFIQYELAVAKELCKPIVGIKPDGDKYISRIVRERSDLIIDWDIEEVVRQIRKPGSTPLAVTLATEEVDDSAMVTEDPPFKKASDQSSTAPSRPTLRERFSGYSLELSPPEAAASERKQSALDKLH